MFLSFWNNLKTDYLHPVYLWLSKHFWLRESSRLQRITWRPTCQRPWSSSCRPSRGRKGRAACPTPTFWSSASSAWIGRCWISSPPTTMKQVKSATLSKIEVRLNLPFCMVYSSEKELLMTLKHSLCSNATAWAVWCPVITHFRERRLCWVIMLLHMAASLMLIYSIINKETRFISSLSVLAVLAYLLWFI